MKEKELYRLAFVGDIYCPKKEENDTISFSPRLKELLESCDLRICNLEAPCLHQMTKPTLKAGPTLHQPVQTIHRIEELGFNLINLANNHIFDYGTEGLKQTLGALNVPTIGAGTNLQEAFTPYLHKGGTDQQIGIIGMGEAEFGAITLKEDQPGFAWINHSQTNEMVRETKKGCDKLFIFVHAGVELTPIPLPEWRQRYRELIDNGADGIIASHPHVPQGWETYKGCPIFYSLGNFFFDSTSNHIGWNRGIIAIIDISRTSQLTFEAIITQKTENYIDILTEFTDNDPYAPQKLCSILSDPIAYQQETNNMVMALWEERYLRHYENGINGIAKPNVINLLKFIKRLLTRKALNIPMLLHNQRIESHHYAVTRALELMYRKTIDK